MSFSDMIGNALTGGRGTQAVPFVDQLRAAVKGAGSNRALARQIGVGEASIRRWLTGSTRPKAGNMGKVTGAFTALPEKIRRRALLDSAAANRWRANGMVIETADGRNTRRLDARRLRLHPDTGKRVVDAWLAGDDAEASRRFRAGIGDDWYREEYFGQWATDDDLAYEGSEVDEGSRSDAMAVTGAR